ncbi:MAG: hypothetical protein ABIH66_06860 [bacterium]
MAGGLPSARTETSVERPSFLGSALFDTKAGTLAAGHGALKPGTVLGKVTASGKLAPVARTTVNAASASGQKVVNVADAGKIQIGNTVKITRADDKTAYDQGVVTDRDTESAQNTITMTDNLANSYSSGDLARVVDGSETAVGILLQYADSGASSDDEDYGDKGVAIVIAGNVVAGNCTGLDEQGRSDLNTAETGVIYFSDRI